MISSMLSIPSWFSIFEMILMPLFRLSRIACTASTSRALRTNEWAMKSTPFSVAHSMYMRSFSVTEGRSIDTLGTLTLLRERSVQSRMTRHTSSSADFCSTCSSISPSAMSIVAPAGTSRTMCSTFM